MQEAHRKDSGADEEHARRKQRKDDERCLAATVNVAQVSMPVIKRWIADTLGEQLPDDDVAVEFIHELLVGAENDEPDIGVIRDHMNDFLGKDKSRAFCLDLWRLLLSAQDAPDGVPQKLVDERRAKIEADERARRETDSILKQLRPKPSFAKNRASRSKVSFRDSEDNSGMKASASGHRVGKPSRKTNYNRS